MRIYREMGAVDRYQIERVNVTGGDVEVLTGMFPKAENEPLFTGACTLLVDAYDWIKSVTINTSAEERRLALGWASWKSGDLACTVDLP